MPYIKQEDRDKLDPFLEGAAHNIDNAGQLNYAITKLAQQYLADLTGAPMYADFNEVIGALECAKQEFYRSVVAPYEDRKRQENGDVVLKGRGHRVSVATAGFSGRANL